MVRSIKIDAAGCHPSSKHFLTAQKHKISSTTILFYNKVYSYIGIL